MSLENVLAGAGAITSINQNFDSVAAAAVYGRRMPGSTALTWAYNGGKAFGASISDGTVTLTASSTNYVVADRSTGAVSVSTSSTAWNNATGYARLYSVVTGTETVTSWEDFREFMTTGGGGGGGGGDAGDVTYDNSISGLSATNVQDAIDELAGASSVSARRVNVALSDLTTALAAGTLKAFWVAPEDGTLTDLWLALGAAQSSSGVVRVDLNKAGTTVLSTRPAIDATESTSLTGTAAVISSASFTKGDIFTFDIDDAGTGAKGLQAVLEYTP